MIKVLFFASLREQLGAGELTLEATRAGSVDEVRAALVSDQPAWAEALGRTDLLMAVNQTLVKPGTAISDGDEVAFFPPVTGG